MIQLITVEKFIHLITVNCRIFSFWILNNHIWEWIRIRYKNHQSLGCWLVGIRWNVIVVCHNWGYITSIFIKANVKYNEKLCTNWRENGRMIHSTTFAEHMFVEIFIKYLQASMKKALLISLIWVLYKKYFFNKIH